tara:strand:+ start:1891 stop:2943 length:1053 start_codon:yes stop_codon:yes gene_type:complete
MTKNILFIASAASIHSLKWINYFSENTDHNIHWAFVSSMKYKIDKNIKIINIKKNWILNSIKLIFKLKKTKDLIVHLHYVGKHSLFLIFLNRDAKLITNTWGSDLIFNKYNFLRRIWLGFIISRSNIVISDAYHHYEFLKKYNLQKEKFKYVPYGTDTDKFKPINSSFSRDDIQIINTRGFDEVYDAKTLILAANIVLREYPNIIFKFAGKGSQEIYLKNLVKKLQIQKNVIFLGFISQKELFSELNRSDIYVSCSLRDGGLAGSTSEAMSCERISVISDNSDNNKWIIDNDNGFLFQNSNFEELAQKIIWILKNKEECIEKSKKARDTIVERNCYFKQMNKVNKIYELI